MKMLNAVILLFEAFKVSGAITVKIELVLK